MSVVKKLLYEWIEIGVWRIGHASYRRETHRNYVRSGEGWIIKLHTPNCRRLRLGCSSTWGEPFYINTVINKRPCVCVCVCAVLHLKCWVPPSLHHPTFSLDGAPGFSPAPAPPPRYSRPPLHSHTTTPSYDPDLSIYPNNPDIGLGF